jgi:PAS domain S-box-containing protein
MAVSICLNSRFPMVLWWGREFVMLYNDAWRPILGAKHPKGLGRPGIETWPEIWDIIGEQLGSVLKRGGATWSEDLLLAVARYGYVEEAYFTYSYSPIKAADGRVQGVFTAVNETTERVLSERRMRILRELTARTAESKSVKEACRTFAEVLGDNNPDVPFALLYLVDDDARGVSLAASAGLQRASYHPDAHIALDGNDPWSIARAVRQGGLVVVEDLHLPFGTLPGGAWPEPTTRAIVSPIVKSGQRAGVTGVLIAGINPRRALDDSYRGFFDLVTGHMATAVANSRAYEEERRRSEALAEIDRAKTTFFSNASHEFRTPLSLMLGPLEDMLGRRPTAATIISERRDLELMHRNGLRLLKLVNTLLDFSRIEAGRIQAVYEPVDLAAYTAELASTFRSAMSRAGLRFTIDCPTVRGPVYVDRDMWEKIVLNLLSNAFKYTLDGGVAVVLRKAGSSVQLAIHDTGVGIPESELPRLFERFHRVEGQRSRTTEGTGIGLALVQELVKLHGGTVRAQSVLGKGTTFTVTIPTGTTHLPSERISGERTVDPAGIRAEAFVEEALRWLPGSGTPHEDGIEKELIGLRPAGATGERAAVLVADDNADMLEYVRRLLATRYEVEAVPDGQTAFDAARARRPDLILTDVMMPRLDGFGLLKAVRADNALRDVPVVLLSARAGEESKVEGLEAGADDYLLKPFSARELIARVDANLRMARLRHTVVEERKKEEFARRYSEERHRVVVETANDAVVIMDESGAIQFANAATMRVFGYDPTELIGKPLTTLMPEPMRKLHEMGVRRYLATGQRHMNWRGTELTGLRKDGQEFPVEVSFGELTNNGRRLFTGFIRDISERRRAEQERERLRQVEADLAYVNRVSTMGELTASLAHEIKQPIAAALTDAKTCLRWLSRDQPDVPEAQDAASRVIKDATHATEIISRIGSLFKKGPLQRESIEVNQVIQEMIALLRIEAARYSITIHSDLTNGLPQINADRVQVQQVLMNLMLNGIEAMKDLGSGGELTIKSQKEDDGQILVSVRDTGVGLRPEHKEQIFNAFFTTKPQGTGMGLAISRSIIESHGGHLWATPNAGRGATFQFTLPNEATMREAVISDN